MKKLIALLLAMLMVIGMFAGCDSTPATTDPNASQGDNTEGTPSGKEKVKLTWWTYESEINTPIFKKWLAKFHEKYDWIEIEVTYLPTDTGPEKTTIAFATDTYPDIISDIYSRLAPAVDAGKTISLQPAIDRIPGLTISDEGLIDGEHHYIWQGSSAAYCVVVNMDIAEEIGVLDRLPQDGLTWSWDDFMYCLRKAKEHGYIGITLFAGSQSSDMWYYSWLMGNGVEICDPQQGILLANKPEYRAKAVEVLNFLKNIVDEGLCQPGAATNIDTDTSKYFQNNKSLMQHNAFNNTAAYMNEYDNGISMVENFQFYPLPTKDGRVGGGDCGAFSSAGVIAFDTVGDGSKLEAIYEAIVFYHSKEGEYFQDCFDAAPAGIPVLDHVVIDESAMDPIFVEQNLNRGNPYAKEHARSEWGPGCGWYADFRMCLFPFMSSFYAGNMTAEQVLENWEAMANNAIATYIEKNTR